MTLKTINKTGNKIIKAPCVDMCGPMLKPPDSDVSGIKQITEYNKDQITAKQNHILNKESFKNKSIKLINVIGLKTKNERLIKLKNIFMQVSFKLQTKITSK